MGQVAKTKQLLQYKLLSYLPSAVICHLQLFAFKARRMED